MRTVALMRVGVEEEVQVEVELEDGSSVRCSSAPDPAADSELPNSGYWSLSDLVSSSLIHPSNSHAELAPRLLNLTGRGLVQQDEEWPNVISMNGNVGVRGGVCPN